MRAEITTDLATSDHTAVKPRLAKAGLQEDSLPPICASVPHPRMPLSERDYVALLDWAGRIARPDKRGVITGQVPSVLRRLDLDATAWRTQVLGIESRYWRAVGSVEALVEKARQMGQCWLKGSGIARLRRVLAAD